MSTGKNNDRVNSEIGHLNSYLEVDDLKELSGDFGFTGLQWLKSISGAQLGS